MLYLHIVQRSVEAWHSKSVIFELPFTQREYSCDTKSLLLRVWNWWHGPVPVVRAPMGQKSILKWCYWHYKAPVSSGCWVHSGAVQEILSSRQFVLILITFYLSEAWGFCHLPGALAFGHLWVSGLEEEHWERRATSQRPFLCALDSWSLHEASWNQPGKKLCWCRIGLLLEKRDQPWDGLHAGLQLHLPNSRGTAQKSCFTLFKS